MVNEIMTPERILLDIVVENKKDLLLELCRNLKIKNWRKVHKSVIKREKIMSTGIGEGIAIPRAFSDTIKGPTGCLAILRHPIDYESLDRRPVKIALLLAFPEKYQKYAETIATFIELLAQESIKRHLISLKTEEEVIRYLSNREEE